jgi:hypothetical protein
MGNLIFQYQAAISLFSENSTIISIDSEFSEAFEVLPFVKFISLPKALSWRLTYYLANVLRWLAKKAVFSYATSKWEPFENNFLEIAEIERRQGWFSGVWVMEGFFQHDHFANPKPNLKQALVDRAEKLLQQIPKERRVAVHLRLGDYKQWVVLGKRGVCLPSSYYEIAMDRIAETTKNPVFVIFSDDRKEAEKLIGNKYETRYFDGGAPDLDIAGMSLCSHAIISASTFSWWGAFLIKCPKKIIIAPLYWAGFKSCVWFPKDIQTKYFEYIDVSKCERQGKSE